MERLNTSKRWTKKRAFDGCAAAAQILRKTALFFIFFLVLSLPPYALENAEIETLLAFSNPARIWGEGAERLIEEAYRACFKTYIIGGKVMNIRMPFAENHERDQLVEGGWEFLRNGKGDPVELWPVIDKMLESEDFAEYAKQLGDGREKVVIFNIAKRKWSVSTDVFDLSRMKSGAYHGLPHIPYILVDGQGIKETDVYNYLYCIAWTGLDCSGFVWHIQSYISRRKGVDLGQTLRRVLGVPRGGRASFYAGTSFYDSHIPEIIQVEDKIKNLRPGDIMLFRSSTGGAAHSAVIQSIDWTNGIIRYFQDTDEAPPLERGVHESYVSFEPSKTGVSLKDMSLVWSQQRYAPFPGERSSTFPNDGARYRAFGGGKVVRFKAVAAVLNKK